jgi:hypothetical protein
VLLKNIGRLCRARPVRRVVEDGVDGAPFIDIGLGVAVAAAAHAAARQLLGLELRRVEPTDLTSSAHSTLQTFRSKATEVKSVRLKVKPEAIHAQQCNGKQYCATQQAIRRNGSPAR